MSDLCVDEASTCPHFLALAVDYDGTIAENGIVAEKTFQALRRLKETGRRLVLVTGRELVELKHAFPRFAVFDRIVAENGALIYDPATGHEHALAPAPPAAFVQRLVDLGVEPVSVGRVVVATWRPHEHAVLRAIQDLGLELHMIFNKGAIMVLPAGVSKASGLRAALKELEISAINTVAVGDAENDHAFLQACGCAAAVANALPALKNEADVVLSGDHGLGVAELVDRIIAEDAALVPPGRRGLFIGSDHNGKEIFVEPDHTVLIAGNSGSGKSSFATLLTERMVKKDFEFCVIDPEGDYLELEGAVTIGDIHQGPAAEEALRLLLLAGVNVVISILALSLPEREALFAELLPATAKLRARSGRPHWLIVDEAHHVLPAAHAKASTPPESQLSGTILVTVDARTVNRYALQAVDVVLACGSTAADAVITCAALDRVDLPEQIPTPGHDEILFWSRRSGLPPSILSREAPRQAHNRHSGKYATGDLGPWKSFYFRGPGKSLNARASNLSEFLRIAATIDDSVWEYHLQAGDFEEWFRHVIRDDDLADEAAAIAGDANASPFASRTRVADAIRRRYVVK